MQPRHAAPRDGRHAVRGRRTRRLGMTEAASAPSARRSAARTGLSSSPARPVGPVGDARGRARRSARGHDRRRDIAIAPARRRRSARHRRGWSSRRSRPAMRSARSRGSGTIGSIRSRSPPPCGWSIAQRLARRLCPQCREPVAGGRATSRPCSASIPAPSSTCRAAAELRGQRLSRPDRPVRGAAGRRRDPPAGRHGRRRGGDRQPRLSRPPQSQRRRPLHGAPGPDRGGGGGFPSRTPVRELV